MCKILLSIHPEYVRQIIDGNKRYEFRKILAKRKVELIVIYCTSPVKQVLGEVRVKSVLVEEPELLWERTKHFAGISKDRYDEYFSDKSIAYAYELGELAVFESPKELNSFGVDVAPQSFVYLD